MNITTADMDALDALDGLITRDVGECIYELAREIPSDQAIVEIGAWKGKSTCYLAAGRRDGQGGYVISVDPWSTDVQEWSRYHTSATLREWDEQVTAAGFSNDVIPLQGKSTDVAIRWDGAPIGMLYVDGDHSRHAVITDFHAWRPYLTEHAIVVFDDYGVSHNPDVKPAVHEMHDVGALIIQEIAANGRVAVCKVAAW